MAPGWRFPTTEDTDAAGENVIPDPVPGHEGFTHLRDLYFSVNPSYEGRFTVPVLYDIKTKTIVNNESSEILRMLGTEVSYTSIGFPPSPAESSRLLTDPVK
jgi:putative glutathione S-transferase